MIRLATADEKIAAELAQALSGLSVQVVNWDGTEEQLISHDIHVVLQSDSHLKNGRIFQKWLGCIWVLQSREENTIASSYAEGHAEDIVWQPFVRNELITKIRWANHFHQLRDLENSSASVAALMSKLEEDLSLAEKIQRRLIRDKFPEINSLSVKTKYYCGLRSGGDYFDLIQFPDGNVAVLLTDSSSYGLSSKLLQSLTHIGLAANPVQEPAQVIKEIFGALNAELNEKNKLGIFLGILNKKTYEFQFQSYGDFWLLQSSDMFSWHLKGDGQPALHSGSRLQDDSQRIQLRSGDRLLLCSDGVREAIGAEWELAAESTLMNSGADAHRVINELSYKMKKSSGEMPAQDCSFLFLQVPDKALRLAL